MNTKPYRRVLDIDVIMDTCWNCKTEEVRVDTSFGPVCFGCEIILNALPTAELDMTQDDVITYDAATVEWVVTADIVPGKPSFPALFFNAKGENGVSAWVRHTSAYDWEWTVSTEDGDGEGCSQSPDNPYKARTLGYLLNRAAEKIGEWEEEADAYDFYQDFDYGDEYDDYAYDNDSDLMNEY